MRVLLTLSFLAIFSSVCFSQKARKSDLYGKVSDSTSKKGIEYATIQLLDSNSVEFKYGIISDSAGRFFIPNVDCRWYKIVVSSIGYKTKKFYREITAKGSSFFVNIALTTDEYQLGKVVIKGEQTGVKTMVDKIVFVPDSISLKNSATGLDLLAKAPGVSVSKADQTIKLIGNPKVLVLIDGSNSNRSFSALEPNDIEKIEIINNPSAKYDSDVPGVINVVLKEERKKGLKISTNLTYFSQNKHNTSNIQVDYEFSKFRVFGLYKLNASHTTHYEFQSERLTEVDGASNSISNTSGDNNKNAHVGNIFQYGIDYLINKKTLINFTGNYEIHTNTSNLSSVSRYVVDDALIYKANLFSDDKGKNRFQNYTLFVKRKFNSEDQKLTLNTNVYFMRRDKDLLQNMEYLSHLNPAQLITKRNISDHNQNNSVNTKLDYTHPFSKLFYAETGVNLYQRTITSNQIINGDSLFFKYNDFRTAYYATLSYNKDRFSAQIGIRCENFYINFYDSIKFNQWNYMPSLSALYNLSKESKIKLLYKEYLSYPRYQLLSPYTYYSGDSMTISSGNPYLKPEKLSNLELNYSYKQKYTFVSVSINYKQKTDLIGIRTRLSDRNVIIEKHDNIAKSDQIGGYLYAQALLLGFIHPGLYFECYHNRFDDSQYNGWSFKSWLSTEFSLPLDLYLNIDASIQGKEFYYDGYYLQNPLIDEVTLGMSILKGKGEISISLLNYFLLDEYQEKRWNSDYLETSSGNTDSKCVLIRFNYFFKKGKQLKNTVRELNMEKDEK